MTNCRSIRGTRLALAVVAMVLVSHPTRAAISDDTKSHPNVLLIMTDDQGWGDVRAHGNEMIDTPNLDHLYGAGARFERFFVSPVCAPTRSSLLTGRYNLRTHVHGVTRGHENMRSEEVTIAEILKANGYATGCFGKWHNGAHYPMHPNGQGFDEFFGFCAGHWNTYFDTLLETNGELGRTEGFITDVITDAALEFISARSKQPFFCYVPYNAPHSPWQVPDRYFDKYKERGADDTLACAYGMVENIDDNIGRLLQRLDDLKLAENTIVIFLTDNGANSPRYNGDMRGRKGSVHEGGSRVPMFVRWPAKIKPGTVVKQISAHIDVLPTLVELCGVKPLDTLPLDGDSLAAHLQGAKVRESKRQLFTFRRQGDWGAVRTQRWRAVKERRGWELYDMLADPGQKQNVAKDHAEELASLRKAYEAKLADVTAGGYDPLPIPVGHRERAVVTMPGHEAFFVPAIKEGISYFGKNGWANDWVANWTSVDAHPWWPVEVVEDGTYEVSLLYCCPKADVGAKLRVEVGGQQAEAAIAEPHDPPRRLDFDRVTRKETYDRDWAELRVGKVKLSKGETTLAIKALSKPGKIVADIKAVKVRRVD